MAGEIERLISNLESMDGPGRDVDEARAELAALREELHTRGVTIDHLSAENARLREALKNLIDRIDEHSCDDYGIAEDLDQAMADASAALGGRDD